MVNTYISDVFFNMDHGYNINGSGDENDFENMNDNAEMLISMIREITPETSVYDVTVEELKADYFSRL